MICKVELRFIERKRYGAALLAVQQGRQQGSPLPDCSAACVPCSVLFLYKMSLGTPQAPRKGLPPLTNFRLLHPRCC